MGIQTDVKFTYLVVTKRINTRIFFNKVHFLIQTIQINPTKSINRKINFLFQRNPHPGTCVDDIITLPERYDFFIVRIFIFCTFDFIQWYDKSSCTQVPQTVREGTVSPTSFNVIHDTMGLPPDRLQQLAFRFTFFYVSFYLIVVRLTWLIIYLFIIRLAVKFSTFFFIFQFNWSGTVKVPALCQYAHKLSFLASQSMQGMPNTKLDNTLYYL